MRKVLPDQVGARPEGQWGFHEADELKKNADCRSRKIGDTTDTGYSNKRNRQSVRGAAVISSLSVRGCR